MVASIIFPLPALPLVRSRSVYANKFYNLQKYMQAVQPMQVRHSKCEDFCSSVGKEIGGHHRDDRQSINPYFQQDHSSLLYISYVQKESGSIAAPLNGYRYDALGCLLCHLCGVSRLRQGIFKL